MTRMLTFRRTFLPVVLCAVSVAPMALLAQDDGTDGPTKVLVIIREMTKPGRGGMMHEKTEGVFAQALKTNHVDFHYFAMTSMSGPDRALFLAGYPSLAAWETANKAMGGNAALGAMLDRANVADGDLLSETNESVWLRRDDMSMNSHNLVGDRYMQISQYMVKPGHVAEWEKLVKMVKEGYAKGIPDAAWDMFEERYGANGNAYIVITPLKTLGEVDGMLGSGKAFMNAMGEEGMKKMGELEAECVASWQMNLFAFNPRMSNPPESFVKAEPDYWKVKTAPVKKAEAKPAQ